MTREALFAAVRPFAPGQKFNSEVVKAIDALADTLGVELTAASSSGHRTSHRGLDLIHSFESCRLAAYADPGSVDGHPWTIGWGSTGLGIATGVVWTQRQADDRFAADLAKFEKGVAGALAGAAVTQGQFDALVSFAYNVGIKALTDSTLLRMHRAGDYAGAFGQFSRWNKNDGRTMAGLTRRRAAEAALYTS